MAGFISEERLCFGPWPAMERTLARFIEHQGFNNVSVVGGSGDRGADVVGMIDNQKWVLQSKYRRDGQVDSEGAKEAVKAMSFYKADVAVAATNQAFNDSANRYHLEQTDNGTDLRLWGGKILLDWYSDMDSKSLAYRELRDYQFEAVDAVEMARSNGSRNALVLMATGLGKSLVLNQLVNNELSRNPNQEVLVLAHTVPLVRQLERQSWSQLDKEYSTHLWTDGEQPAYHGGVVFATYQTVVNVTEELTGKYGLVIVDEAHNAGAVTYKELLERLSPNFLVGLTATPWRGDGQNLEGTFGEPVFSMDIIEGMQRGFLAEVDYRMLTDDIDWDEVSAMTEQGLSVKDLNSKLILPDRDEAMVDVFCSHYNGLNQPKALAFCRSIEHATMLQMMFQTRGVKTGLIHSKMSREQQFQMLSGFREGIISLLLSVDMLNEGIDIPDVGLVGFMRVTHSRRIFVQQLGRGLRLSAGKSKVVVLDFVADIKRLAEGIHINNQAAKGAHRPETVKYTDGTIVKFDNDKPASFFEKFLADVADIADMGDSAKLKFPETITNSLESF